MPQPRGSPIRVSKVLIADYIDWLCGPNVWGLTSKDVHGKVLSSPTLDNVLGYDWAIRKSISKGMNRGVDFATGLAAAQADNRLLQLHFLTPVAMSPAKAVTAPNVLASVPALVDNKRPWSATGSQDSQAPASKKSKNAQKEINKLKEELRKAQNAKGQPKGAKGAKGQGKGQKGGGKAEKGQRLSLPDGILKKWQGKAICFNWNESRSCSATPSGYSHVCWFCGSGDHKGPECTQAPQ